MLSVEEADYSPRVHQVRHAHERHTVSFILSGGLRERVGGKEEIAGPLSIVTKPAGTEHQDDFGPAPTRLLRITLDPDLSRDCAYLGRPLTSWRWHTASPATSAFLGLLRHIRSKASLNGREIHDRGCDVLAAIANGYQKRPRGAPPRWLEVVRERLDDTQQPRVAELASGAGVHPVYLARQFRRWYGMSIREHLKRRRAQAAASALAQGARTISAASYDAGFSDHSHLCRVFKRTTGLTPVAFRALLGDQV
jgi:AraC family transcriptional regulator